MKFDCEKRDKNLYNMKMYVNKSYFEECENKVTDLSMHLYSQISVFAICYIKSTIAKCQYSY